MAFTTPHREERRRISAHRDIYALIDSLALYATRIFRADETPFGATRLGMYYNRTGKNRIATHTVTDGILVVRVE